LGEASWRRKANRGCVEIGDVMVNQAGGHDGR
jgi:hypothetical protein